MNLRISDNLKAYLIFLDHGKSKTVPKETVLTLFDLNSL